jgi:speckle-type POZ protein
MGSVSKKSLSRYTRDTEQGGHTFEIFGYSLKKGIGVGEFIQSSTFTVGGYDWVIRVYPDGAGDAVKDYVSVYLEIMSKNTEARARWDLRLINQDNGSPVSMSSSATPTVFRSHDATRFGPQNGQFVLRSELEQESSGYIKDDLLVVDCVLTVIKDSFVYNAGLQSEINVPLSDLPDHLGKLLLGKDESDVSFSVGGEIFPAHKIVLAMRSPVFKAQLYGPMKERRARRITVEDIQPAIFRVLLHFIYTDTLPFMDDLNHADYSETIRHLLVAADRYAMDRLKLVCQRILCDYIDVDTVAATLALADQHNCDKLKEVCIEFLEYIASSDGMDAIVATEGYASLKRTCPSVLLEVFEKTSRSRKT